MRRLARRRPYTQSKKEGVMKSFEKHYLFALLEDL